MKNILAEVIGKIADMKAAGKEIEFTDVFTSDVLEQLAVLSEELYKSFVVQLQAYLITEKIKINGMTERKLGWLVLACAERLKEERMNPFPAALADYCPDAPDAGKDIFIPIGWHLDDKGVMRINDKTDEPGPPICTSPVYIAERQIDDERQEMFLRVVVKSDGVWKMVLVPVKGAVQVISRAIITFVMRMDALILNEKAMKEYLTAFLEANWRTMPTKKIKLDVYDELRAFVEENADRFDGNKANHWGKFGTCKEGNFVAIKPGVLQKFARQQSVSVENLLSMLEKSGKLLAAKDCRYRVVQFANKSRRMAVVLWEDPVEKQGENPLEAVH